jgi:hypothetical protein
VATNPAARRQAIEDRLNRRARAERVDVNRLRRALVFERLLVRLESGDPGAWVIKGGMALEWRLGLRARATRDLDLVVRGEEHSAIGLRNRLVELLTEDPQADHFVFEVGPAAPLDVGFRFPLRATLAGREFASVRVDVAARSHELLATEHLHLPPAVPAYDAFFQPQVELAATSQQFAEKLHALTRNYGDHPNTRVRDLVDLMILIESDLVEVDEIVPVVHHVFESRGLQAVPEEIPEPPSGWSREYALLAVQTGLTARTLGEALAHLRRVWVAARRVGSDDG